MTNFEFAALGVGLLGLLTLCILILLRLYARGGRETSRLESKLVEIEMKLATGMGRATTDLATRIEATRGDLRADLAERLRQGFGGLRDSLDSQLASGRAEHSLAVKALEEKFDGLRTTTETMLEGMDQRQGHSLRDSRLELVTAMNTLATNLQNRFDALTETHASAAREARAELSATLGEVTRDLQLRLGGLEEKNTLSLDALRAKVDEKLQAISDQVQQKLQKNIEEGFHHFEKVQEHLRLAEEQLRNVSLVGRSINELNSLLKLPHLRGKFGEMELGRLLADFLPASAYEEQAVIVPGSQERVDAVVHFPNFRLPIDSKFNREQILPLFETTEPDGLKQARETLHKTIRAQAREIRDKYVHPEHGTADLALMFIPSETIYFEVIRNGVLCDELHRTDVFPVSPNTLAITLKSIAMSASYFEFAKNAERTLEEIKKAQKSFGFFQDHFETVGRQLNKARDAYDKASGHLRRYSSKVVSLTGEPVGQEEIEGGEETRSLPTSPDEHDE